MSYPRICIQQSISAGKPTPALWSEIEAAMRDPRIQDICDQIKLLDGQDPDELSRLKRQLPVITPHACRFTGDGKRKSANAVPSGLVMLDIDHVAEPKRIYAEHIAPMLAVASGCGTVGAVMSPAAKLCTQSVSDGYEIDFILGSEYRCDPS